jgi:hypothetical protein
MTLTCGQARVLSKRVEHQHMLSTYAIGPCMNMESSSVRRSILRRDNCDHLRSCIMHGAEQWPQRYVRVCRLVPQRTHALAEDEPAEGWRRAAPGPAGEQLVNAELRLKP